MSTLLFSRRRRALLLGLCGYMAGGGGIARPESASPSQPPDVVRRYDVGRFNYSYKYGYAILDDALEHSLARYGPYRVEPVSTEMSENRVRQEILKGDLVNVMVHNADHKEINEELLRIDVALDKGLEGYRLVFIRTTDQGRVNQVRDINGLRQLQVGTGEQWSDVAIFHYNRIYPVTAKNYESLLLMLERGRFDLFPRTATGILAEYDNCKGKYPDLTIDQHLLIYWPTAKYIYVSKSAPRLAERIRYGLHKMQQDGSFEKHFEKHSSQVMAKLNLPGRMLIELENPLLPTWAKISRPELR
jgi:hypothetical protein